MGNADYSGANVDAVSPGDNRNWGDSIQNINIVDIICEGPVKGIIGRENGIYLNDVSVEHSELRDYVPSTMESFESAITFDGTTKEGIVDNSSAIPDDIEITDDNRRDILLTDYLKVTNIKVAKKLRDILDSSGNPTGQYEVDEDEYRKKYDVIGVFTERWTTNPTLIAFLSRPGRIVKGVLKYTHPSSPTAGAETTAELEIANSGDYGIIEGFDDWTLRVVQKYRIADFSNRDNFNEDQIITVTKPNGPISSEIIPIAGTYEFIITKAKEYEGPIAQQGFSVAPGTVQGIYDKQKIDGLAAYFNNGAGIQAPLPAVEGVGGAVERPGVVELVTLPDLKMISAKAGKDLSNDGQPLGIDAGGMPVQGSARTDFNDGATILPSASFGLGNATLRQQVDEVMWSISYPALQVISLVGGKKQSAHAMYIMEIRLKRDGVYETLNTGTSNEKPKWLPCFPAENPYVVHSGNTNAGTNFDHVVNLHPFRPFEDFQIRIIRVTRHIGLPVRSDGTNGGDTNHDEWQLAAQAKVTSVSSVIQDNFTYPYSALCSLSFSSQQFQNAPTRSYLMEGLLIKIPSNYTPREYNNGVSKYDGFWDGTFKTLPYYTNNPAWVFYDILTNNRYGAGRWIRHFDIDKYSLYRIARYCDELVPSGNKNTDGTDILEPRFTANLFLTKSTDIYKVLKDIATIFLGILYWHDGKLTPVNDSPQDSIYSFSTANVINGDFGYESSGTKTRVNQVVVTYHNPEINFEPTPIILEDRDAIVKTGKIVSQKSVAFGATSEGQATRYGRWKLWTAQNQTEIIHFKTALAAEFIQPGDVIDVQDRNRFGIALSGRVKTVNTSTSPNTLTLDRSITLISGDTYQLNTLVTAPAAFWTGVDPLTITDSSTSPATTYTYNKGERVTHAYVYKTTGADSVGSITITNGGSGYPNTGATITFSDPQTGVDKTTGTVLVQSGIITSITITNAGSGYTSAPTVTFSTPPSPGVSAVATAQLAEYTLSIINTETEASNAFKTADNSTPLGLLWKNYSYVQENTIVNSGNETSSLTLDSTTPTFGVAPAVGTVWGLVHTASGGSVAGTSRQYKVLDLKKDEKNITAITAVEFYNEKFIAVEKSYELGSIPQTIYKAIEPEIIPPPTNLRIIIESDATSLGEELGVEWDAPESSYVDKYELTHNVTGLQSPIIIKDNKYSLTKIPDGDLIISVRTISPKNNYSRAISLLYKVEDPYNTNVPRMFEGIPKGIIANTTAAMIPLRDSSNNLTGRARITFENDPTNVVSIGNSLDKAEAVNSLFGSIATTPGDEHTITNPGNGYQGLASVTVEGDGSGAVVLAVVHNGIINRVYTHTPGSGFTTQPTLTIEGSQPSGGTTATAIAKWTNAADYLEVDLDSDPGVLYHILFDGGTSSTVNNRKIDLIYHDTESLELPFWRHVGYGTRHEVLSSVWTAVTTLEYLDEYSSTHHTGIEAAENSNKITIIGNYVNNVTIDTAGSGYTSAPTVAFDMPKANPLARDARDKARGVATISTGGLVTGISVYDSSDPAGSITTQRRGFGYKSSPAVTITGGGGSGATATANLKYNFITDIKPRDIVVLGSANCTNTSQRTILEWIFATDNSRSDEYKYIIKVKVRAENTDFSNGDRIRIEGTTTSTTFDIDYDGNAYNKQTNLNSTFYVKVVDTTGTDADGLPTPILQLFKTDRGARDSTETEAVRWKLVEYEGTAQEETTTFYLPPDNTLGTIRHYPFAARVISILNSSELLLDRKVPEGSKTIDTLRLFRRTWRPSFTSDAIFGSIQYDSSAGGSYDFRKFITLNPDLLSGTSVKVDVSPAALDFTSDGSALTSTFDQLLTITANAVGFKEPRFKIIETSADLYGNDATMTTTANLHIDTDYKRGPDNDINTYTVTLGNNDANDTANYYGNLYQYNNGASGEVTVSVVESYDQQSAITGKGLVAKTRQGESGVGLAGFSSMHIFAYKVSTTALSATDKPGTVTVTLRGENAGKITTPVGDDLPGTGWKKTIPAQAAGEQLYISTATASGNGDTDEVFNSDWTPPEQLGRNGMDGISIATVQLFVRYPGGVAPAAPGSASHELTYHFRQVGSGPTAGTLEGTASAFAIGSTGYSWSQTNWSNSRDPLWRAHATAFSADGSANDVIPHSEWIVNQENTSGAGRHIFYIYKESLTKPSEPESSFNSGQALTVNMLTGQFTNYPIPSGAGSNGRDDQGWKQTFEGMPTDGTDNKVWITSATANGVGDTETIAYTEWVEPSQFFGEGKDGLNSAPVNLYLQSNDATNVPPVPTVELTYHFFDYSVGTPPSVTSYQAGQITPSNLTGGWVQVEPQVTAADPYVWRTTAMAQSNQNNDTIQQGDSLPTQVSTGDWSTPIITTFYGEAGTDAPRVADSYLYATFDTGDGVADTSTLTATEKDTILSAATAPSLTDNSYTGANNTAIALFETDSGLAITGDARFTSADNQDNFLRAANYDATTAPVIWSVEAPTTGSGGAGTNTQRTTYYIYYTLTEILEDGNKTNKATISFSTNSENKGFKGTSFSGMVTFLTASDNDVTTLSADGTTSTTIDGASITSGTITGTQISAFASDNSTAGIHLNGSDQRIEIKDTSQAIRVMIGKLS